MRQFLLIGLILQLIFSGLSAQVNELKFDRILSTHGLSHGNVNAILQDSEGYMWFGTSDGLNRFDGYNFEIYENDPYNPNSISDNLIRAIYEDKEGNLWIGTSRGLNKYNKRANNFTRYEHNPKDTLSISDNDIQTIYEDRSGILWIGAKSGLNKYDKPTNTFTLYEHLAKHPKAWEYNTIHAIHEDSKGTLWVGTTQGLSKFDRNTEKFTRFNHYTQNSDTLTYVTAIIEDKSGMLWLGTLEDGLKRFDSHTNTFTVYKHNPADKNSIGSNRILSLFEDSFGMLWIGKQITGLDKFDRTTGTFSHYRHNASTNHSISDNTVFSIYEDRSRVLWVGTFTGGVNKIDLLKKKITHYQHNPAIANSLRHNFVLSIYTDRSGEVWVGNPMGIDKLDKKTDTFTHYSYTPTPPENLSYNTAHSIYEDKGGNLWMGLRGGGLQRFNRKSKTFTSFKHKPNDNKSLPHNFVSVIYEDKKGTLWIGTRGGLSKFDPQTETFTTHKPPFQRIEVDFILEDASGVLWLGTAADGLVKFDAQNSIFTQFPVNGLPGTSNKIVNYMYEDKNGMLWLGLNGGGLYTFNRKTLIYTPGSAPKELSRTLISGILEDDKGNLWISTRKKGIYKFNPRTKSLHNYDVSDGLQGNEFNRALCKGPNGEMYFGGNNGFNVFHPDSLRDNPYPPQVAISTFKVFDKPRSFSGNTIKLPYNDNFFSFDFIALSYALPEKNKYAYKLENFDKEWTQAGGRRYASYTNMDPGEYIFRVKAANHDGVWNEQGAAIKIVITPPWWKTWPAYIMYGLMGAAVLYALRYYTISRERLKHNLKLKSLESEKLQELDQMRSKFFTNISHEFRTPLTLIISPLEKMLSRKLSENQKTEFSLMYRNAKRLLQLINQLLDMSKLEAGSMKLETSPGDMVSFVKAHVFSFTSLAESHGIRLGFHHQPETIWASFDKDKLEKIINNLISNAFKFTPQNGEITVTLSLKPQENNAHPTQWIELRVQDSGIGIASDMLEKIFDRFYQIDSSYAHEFEGTGIGLSLTKELAELHGGSIRAISEKGKGACFIVKIPLLETKPLATPGDDGVVEFLDKESSNFKQVLDYTTDNSSEQEDKVAKKLLNEETPLLLVVEDNTDVRTYIRNTFETTYRVIEAKDGVEGLKTAIEHIPDLIISDWMMPRMNGIDLCYQLKTDERTSHIPVIMLTARATVESKLQGLETGADDYLIKPFHTDELVTRAKNLVAGRKKLRERFSRQLAGPSSAPVIPSAEPASTINFIDEKFLQKLMQVIDANLADPDLSIEYLEKEVGMSHGQLYRKVKALTDQSPGEFLRNYRVKKAALFISRKQGNVSQVAYMVGFNNLSYFTKCFRQMYGVPPSEYTASPSQVDLR